MEKFYLCTAIPYANAGPHVGHMLEFVFSDVFARYYKLMGRDVGWSMGTDENGSKMYKTAKEAEMSTMELADSNCLKFKALFDRMNLSDHYFIRTTSDKHRKGAQKLWDLIDQAGDIYKDSYSGLYCVGCEAYLAEKDLVDGKCPNHNKEPEKLTEENYFFRLSKYSDQIAELISSDKLRVYPESRKNEMLSLCKEGLKDVSFSRPKSVLPWGVDVPGDDSQVMYVWCDALSNYITTLGFGDDDTDFDKYWPCDLHVIGKDILRFHAGIWIGMLLSAGLSIPKAIGVHGFITSEGQKMSKSLGNVIDPFEVIEEYGLDAVRFYMTREVPTGDDGDFSRERFEVVYSSDLANNFGNLVSRVIAMLHKYNDGKVVEIEEFTFESKYKSKFKEYCESVESFNLKKAVEAVLAFLDDLNGYIEEVKPWSMVKEGNEAGAVLALSNLIEGIRLAVLMLWPVIPESCEKVLEALGSELDFEDVLSDGAQVQKIEALFPRLN